MDTLGAGARMPLTREDVMNGVSNLPSLPAVVVELLQALGSDEVDAELLARQIGRDQALVAKMLRVANSSFYGLQGKVNSITDAIVVLGLRGVRTLATAAAVTGAFSGIAVQGFDIRMFWRHSIGIALCARVVARHMKVGEDNAFTVGLLHDIGRLVLASCFKDHLVAVLAYQREHDCLLIDAERAVLGIDHALIGEVLTERWHFPPLICNVIAHHHDPDGAEPLACVVHLADAITHALDLVGDENERVPPVRVGCWDTARFDAARLQEMFAEVDAQFEAACGVLLG